MNESASDGPMGTVPTLVGLLQLASACYWIIGILGAVVPALSPSAWGLQGVSFYGRFLLGAARGGDGAVGSSATSGLLGALWRVVGALVATVQSVTVPKRWFSHFYVLGCAVNTGALLLAAGAGYPSVALLPLLALQVHLLRRVCECVWLHAWSPAARMPAVLYLVGGVHYVLLPWTLLPPCALPGGVQSAVPGLLNDLGAFPGPSLLLPAGAAVPALLRDAAGALLHLPPTLLAVAGAGAGVFLAGNAAQHWAHADLASLRPRKGEAAALLSSSTNSSGGGFEALSEVADGGRGMGREALGAGAYAAPPARGLFARCVCPHYGAEVLLYAGLLLMAAALQGRLPLGSALSQSPSAVLAHPPAPCADGAAAPSLERALLLLSPVLLLVWVVSNLGVTALRTRAWYAGAFPAQAARWRASAAMLPGLL